MKCNYKKCRKEILSKKDLVFSWRGIGYIPVPLTNVYHKKCFNEVRTKFSGIFPFSPVNLNRLYVHKIWNYAFLGIIILLFFVMLIIKYSDYGLWGGIGSLIAGVLLSIPPIINLIQIKRVEKLPP